jgi:succinate-semialdehyde dehydrogenase/glutarate-semialdehyde dehydrogenase
MKLASNVPGCSLAIENIFKDAGYPKHVFSSLLVPSSKIESIIRDRRIKGVTLTGSEPAGKSVAAIAGDQIKKSVLELGGSDPFIVLDDADIAKCSSTAVQARMLNAGQSCIAAKRFIIVKSRIEEFKNRQQELISKLKIGDPLDENTDVGPLAREDLVEELHNLVINSVAAGADLLIGGEPVAGKGSFYRPTLLSSVTQGMPVFEEETFGPVTAIIPAENENDAIKIANNSNFGLGASLWTEDMDKAEKLAEQIESGAVFVNGMVKSDPRLPFGGIKNSGYGRELSDFGIREFVNIKTVWMA